GQERCTARVEGRVPVVDGFGEQSSGLLGGHGPTGHTQHRQDPFVHGQGEHSPATVLSIGDRVTTEHARGDVVRVPLHVGRDLVDPVPVRASVGTGAPHQCGGRSNPSDDRGGG